MVSRDLPLSKNQQSTLREALTVSITAIKDLAQSVSSRSQTSSEKLKNGIKRILGSDLNE